MARLMVVDDEKGIREALVQVFEYEGHEVRAAEDGPDALLTAESFHPDVIFLDVKMPGMDGLDVLARLRTECPGALGGIEDQPGDVGQADCQSAGIDALAG